MSEDELRVRPGKIRGERGRHPRASRRFQFSRRLGLPGSSFVPSAAAPFLQRSVVKVAYVPNRADKVWAAHGRYLEREGAQREGARGVGFDSETEERALASALRDWQEEGDSLFWKLIVSPEQAHRMDLRLHARNLMERVSVDLGTRLDWVAIEHQNTDNSHVHIMLRGRKEDGTTLEIDPEYIKHGFRGRSIEIATNELGYRTEREHRETLSREVTALRRTSIDRALVNKSNALGDVRIAYLPPADSSLAAQRRFELGRLQHLRDLGLAQKRSAFTWRLESGFDDLLRELQQAGDIAKRVAQHAPHMRTPVTDLRRFKPAEGLFVTGRLIGTGLESDLYGRSYVLLEGENGVVHYAQQTRRIREARERGQLRLGQTVTLESVPYERRGVERYGVAVWRSDLPDLRELAYHQERRMAHGFRALFEHLLLVDEGQNARRAVATGWHEALKALAELEAPEIRTMDSLERFETPSGKPVRIADPVEGRLQRGRFVGYATSASAEQLAVVDNGRELVGLATTTANLAVGAQVQATAVRDRNRLVWRVDDLERLQAIDRDREGGA
ncbi:MAG: DUF3363 domain-containing protein [bacterium]|nr:DUF3363 domain-containing protein [bacterium]